MRKHVLWLWAIFTLAPVGASAEDLPKPLRIPAEVTYEQAAIMKEAIELHDRGDYDRAIEKYESILSASPDTVAAIYEMGYSYFAKQDYKKALELCEKGAAYDSDLLPTFYMQIASCSDHLGDWEKALEIYARVIREYPRTPLVRFNLALTCSQHEKPDLAISNLKEELYLTPDHPTSHLLLGALFNGGDYRIPAIFALSRFLILEPQSGRSAGALEILQELIHRGVEAREGKNIRITLIPGARKDEGDFNALETALSLASAARFLEKNEDRSAMEKEVEHFGSFFRSLLEMAGREQGGLAFTGDYYVPYFAALHGQGHVEPFVYLIHATRNEKDVRDWLDANMEKVRAFLEWDKKYTWPREMGYPAGP